MDSGNEEFDLTQAQKTRLFELACDSKAHIQKSDTTQSKMDMLYDILNCPLPVNPDVINSLPVLFRGLSSRLHSLAGQPIGNLLQDPTTDVATIVSIKEYAKESGTLTDSEERSDVFLALYYAAIASALVFHNQKITQHSYKDLQEFFLSFSTETWILEEIKDLLRKAHVHCKKIAGRSEGPRE